MVVGADAFAVRHVDGALGPERNVVVGRSVGQRNRADDPVRIAGLPDEHPVVKAVVEVDRVVRPDRERLGTGLGALARRRQLPADLVGPCPGDDLVGRPRLAEAMPAEIDDDWMPEDQRGRRPASGDSCRPPGLRIAQNRVVDEPVAAKQAARHARLERRGRTSLGRERQTHELVGEVVANVDRAGRRLDSCVVDQRDVVASRHEVADAPRLLMRRELLRSGSSRQGTGPDSRERTDQSRECECLLHDSSG